MRPSCDMWIDLIVAHMSRLLIGRDHGRLIPFAALLGGVFLQKEFMVLRDTLKP